MCPKYVHLIQCDLISIMYTCVPARYAWFVWMHVCDNTN